MTIIATLCYIQHENKTFMIHRNKRENDMHLGKYNGLGGKLEAGETPRECAIREVKEECNLQVDELKLAGVITWNPNIDCKRWIGFVYVITKFTGDVINNCPEGELEWVENNKLLSLPLWESDHVFLPKVLAREFFEAEFVWKDTKLLSSLI